MFRRFAPILSLGLLTAAAGWAQTILDDGTPVTILNQRLAMGPPQSQFGVAAVGLPFFTAGVQSFTTTLPITWIGSNPTIPGAGTSTVPVVIVPLIVNFLDGSGTLDATSIVANTIQSPLFTPVDFTTGGTDLGVTQYPDAVQRAEFWTWTNPSGVSPNYHVLLGGPTVLPPVTINVPVGSGHVFHTRVGNLPLGLVNDSFWEPAITSLLPTIGATPNELPIFLAMNIGLYIGTTSNCCILGYHNSTSGGASTAQTWIFASWTSAGIFSGFQDVLGLSHEISEWMNDPFVGALFLQVPGVNWVAPYTRPGQAGCQVNFETGDAVEALANAGGFPVLGATNGFTYHLEDAVFVWWFTHATPSPAVNGQYTFNNILSAPSVLCGPG